MAGQGWNDKHAQELTRRIAAELRVSKLEALLKETRYILENNRVAGDIWAGTLADRITAVLSKSEESK